MRDDNDLLLHFKKNRFLYFDPWLANEIWRIRKIMTQENCDPKRLGWTRRQQLCNIFPQWNTSKPTSSLINTWQLWMFEISPTKTRANLTRVRETFACFCEGLQSSHNNQLETMFWNLHATDDVAWLSRKPWYWFISAANSPPKTPNVYKLFVLESISVMLISVANSAFLLTVFVGKSSVWTSVLLWAGQSCFWRYSIQRPMEVSQKITTQFTDYIILPTDIYLKFIFGSLLIFNLRMSHGNP